MSGQGRDRDYGNGLPLNLHTLPGYNRHGGFDTNAMSKETNGNSRFSEKPSKHDFLYILFPVDTGDSGFITAG
jgi:hypothetical protein